MPIGQMQRFATLRRRRHRSIPDRLRLLREHQAHVRARPAQLADKLTAIEDKIAHYETLAQPGASRREHHRA